MVKSGSDRSDKFSVKYDPNVIMLRIKRLQASMKDKFQNAAYQHALVDANLKNWAKLMNLTYGQLGTFYDITRSVVWQIGNMTLQEIEDLHQRFLSKDFSEEDWLSFLDYMTTKVFELKTFYAFCNLETSKLFSKVSYEPILISGATWLLEPQGYDDSEGFMCLIEVRDPYGTLSNGDNNGGCYDKR